MSGFHDSLGRVGGYSVIDTVLTVAVAGFISQKVPALKKHTGATILGAFVLGEIGHLALGIDTPITKVIKNE